MFVVKNREDNIRLARLIMRAVGGTGSTCSVLDLDALYSSEPVRILSMLAESATTSDLCVPEPGGRVENEFAGLFSSPKNIILVDSVNSLYHLLSYGDVNSRARKLSFGLSALSALSRRSGQAMIFTYYKRAVPFRSGYPSEQLADSTVSVESEGPAVVLKCVRGRTWPGGALSLRCP